MPTRNRKQVKKYTKYRRALPPTDCQFCVIEPSDDACLQETKSFYVIKNKFPYSNWDTQPVADHLMIVPKEHIDSIGSLSASQAIEFVDLVGSYENRGYNVYSRSPQSTMKTVAHLHTHLIKNQGKPKRLILYTRRPYFRLVV